MSLKNSIALRKQYADGVRVSKGMLGMRHTEETKLKIAEAKKKNPTKKCLSCGKLFNDLLLSSSNKKYCSSLCANNASVPLGSVRNSNKYPQYLQVKTTNGWKHIHRLVMEEYLGRPLTSKEEVHHLNGDKHDNRLENLWLFDKKAHSREHFKLVREVQRLRWENAWLRKELDKLKK